MSAESIRINAVYGEAFFVRMEEKNTVGMKKRDSKMRKKPRYIYIIRWTLVVSLALAFITLLALLMIPSDSSSASGKKMAQGVSIDGIDVSGMTRDQAYTAVLGSANSRLSSMAINIKSGSRSYVFTAADIKTSTDIDSILDSALGSGTAGEYKTSLIADDTSLLQAAEKIAPLFDVAPV